MTRKPREKHVVAPIPSPTHLEDRLYCWFSHRSHSAFPTNFIPSPKTL